MKLKNKLILAPMAGITDQVFRQICIEQGADVVYSEMINITGINHLNKKTMFMLKNDYNQKYLAIQLFGSNVEEFVIAAKYVEKHIKPYIIDINMGCPVPKVVNTGAGSALMKKPELIVKIINALIKEIKTPLTIKIRSGWDDNSINCLEIAKIAAKSNIAAIFIHPRTKKQGYTGNADWNLITEIKKNVNIPVIANGDIKSYDDYLKIKKITKADCFGIGRAAIGNPWIFKEIKTKNKYVVSNSERYEVMAKHLNENVKLYGDKIGVFNFRLHLSSYLKGFKNSRNLIKELYVLSDKNEILRLIKEFLNE